VLYDKEADREILLMRHLVSVVNMFENNNIAIQ